MTETRPTKTMPTNIPMPTHKRLSSKRLIPPLLINSTTPVFQQESTWPCSQRCSQCFYHWQHHQPWPQWQCQEHNQKEKQSQQAVKCLTHHLQFCYGFIADPTKSNKHNLYLNLLSSSLLTLASPPPIPHATTPPPFFQSLLGLGLKFWPHPLKTTTKKQFIEVKEWFQRKIFTSSNPTNFSITQTGNLPMRTSLPPFIHKLPTS